MPNIAIITAAYNAAEFIKDTMDSIAAQDYPLQDITHIIVDDCSTDDTYAKTKKLALSAKVRTEVLKTRQNSHQGAARNVGIRAAWKWADAFVILDADDIKYKNFLKEHVEAWQANPQVIGAVYSDYDIWDVANNIVTREYKHPYSKDHLHRECIVSSGALVSKLAFAKCDLFMENVFCLEDYGQWLKISNLFMIKHIPASLWKYRLHGNNSTANANKEKIDKGFQQMWLNYQQWLQNPVGYNG